jgi:hypothetical protein
MFVRCDRVIENLIGIRVGQVQKAFEGKLCLEFFRDRRDWSDIK